MSDFLTKMFCLRCLLLVGLFAAGGHVLADDQNGNKKNDDKKAERIAPELKTLARSVKPDSTSEAQVILRKTNVYIDEQLMSHAISYVAVYILSLIHI